MFTQTIVNGCECYDVGQYRIVKCSHGYHAYKAVSFDDDGNAVGYSSVHKEVDRIERHPELDEMGRKKKDAQGNVIMHDVQVLKAKEYTSLETAIADCT